MSRTLDHSRASAGLAAGSLVAALISAIATEASAAVPPPAPGNRDLMQRVTGIVDAVRRTDPARMQALPRDIQIVQWRNH